jgi:hypothetical protein
MLSDAEASHLQQAGINQFIKATSCVFTDEKATALFCLARLMLIHKSATATTPAGFPQAFFILEGELIWQLRVR